MEISNISNLNTYENLNLEKVSITSLVQKTDEVPKTNSINIDYALNAQSDFSNKITTSINHVSNLQKIESTMVIQENILNNINLGVQSSTDQINLDSKQPSISELMQNFNQSMSTLSSSSYIEVEDGDSTAFFDGMAGSKPLDMSKILDNTKNKLSMLDSLRTDVKQFKAEVVAEVKQDIVQEKINTQSRVVLKDIDFGKESSDFTSNSINNAVGSIATTQTNPSTAHTIRLLSQ